MDKLKGVAVGAGYFSQFHFDAWSRMEDIELSAVCDVNKNAANAAAEKYGVAKTYGDFTEMLDAEQPDFVDIITRPDSHLALVDEAASRSIAIICQKALAPTIDEARQIVVAAETAGVPLMVHENFRFQPWYREIRRQIDRGAIGDRLHAIHFRCRTGDGWQSDAYMSQQPYFREMPRLLIFETGVHFVDTFRFLAGEIDGVYASLKQHNRDIVGEDAATVMFEFRSGTTGLWDGNRFNEPTTADARFTFGEALVEGNGGSLRLYGTGRLTLQKLGEPESDVDYDCQRRGFAGDCVFATQRHFVDCLRRGVPFETSGSEYLKSLSVVEAIYQSADTKVPVRNLSGGGDAHVIDLSLEVNNQMPGVDIAVAKRLEVEGWNATKLTLYSHCGTHMDAPRHFLSAGATLDRQDLSVCVGPATVVHVAPAEPRQLIGVNDLGPLADSIQPESRLLFRTDWHKRYGTPAYRDELPRISLDLAHWLVENKVAMIGVEPPSVADVKNKQELTDVHQTLFRGNVLIVEGLANLDQITVPTVEFIALPMKITGGDGSPVRAIAIEA